MILSARSQKLGDGGLTATASFDPGGLANIAANFVDPLGIRNIIGPMAQAFQGGVTISPHVHAKFRARLRAKICPTDDDVASGIVGRSARRGRSSMRSQRNQNQSASNKNSDDSFDTDDEGTDQDDLPGYAFDEQSGLLMPVEGDRRAFKTAKKIVGMTRQRYNQLHSRASSSSSRSSSSRTAPLARCRQASRSRSSKTTTRTTK